MSALVIMRQKMNLLVQIMFMKILYSIRMSFAGGIHRNPLRWLRKCVAILIMKEKE